MRVMIQIEIKTKTPSAYIVLLPETIDVSA